MALAAEVPLVEGRAGAKGPLTRLMPVRATGISVTKPLQDGEEVVVGGTSVRVFAVPGHTAGSAAYLVREVLFVGDSADAASDSTLVPAPWIFSDSQTQNRQSLSSLARRLRQSNMPVQAIAPAHSGLLTDGTTQLDRFVASLP
jgi:glyoxylase-like metal-dependent hydrolase (beta-lactamase superfamily II)